MRITHATPQVSTTRLPIPRQRPTDDLFELIKDHAEWTSGDGVHFNGKGNEALAKQVAESVLANLSPVELPKK